MQFFESRRAYSGAEVSRKSLIEKGAILSRGDVRVKVVGQGTLNKKLSLVGENARAAGASPVPLSAALAFWPDAAPFAKVTVSESDSAPVVPGANVAVSEQLPPAAIVAPHVEPESEN